MIAEHPLEPLTYAERERLEGRLAATALGRCITSGIGCCGCLGGPIFGIVLLLNAEDPLVPFVPLCSGLVGLWLVVGALLGVSNHRRCLAHVVPELEQLLAPGATPTRTLVAFEWQPPRPVVAEPWYGLMDDLVRILVVRVLGDPAGAPLEQVDTDVECGDGHAVWSVAGLRLINDPTVGWSVLLEQPMEELPRGIYLPNEESEPAQLFLTVFRLDGGDPPHDDALRQLVSAVDGALRRIPDVRVLGWTLMA